MWLVLPKKKRTCINVVGTVQQPQQSFLVVDKRIATDEEDYEIAHSFLLAVFYVFNICYPYTVRNDVLYNTLIFTGSCELCANEHISVIQHTPVLSNTLGVLQLFRRLLNNQF